MYLKTIEIQGFKSFANKLTFSFGSGFTAIVGPNGSGKSNVADAVRWVLGEQSASKLRGGSMQDIIFAGTENRKPLSFAYVAITFDNSDHALPCEFTEVTVARRVYRSGESEYLINGSACRLKDVQELFYDTGIGKEGYSIIGQGQIDRILSKHPEERRELFDEAAGIVKFKRSKAATVKKLEKERENLQRINDVLGEQERQLAPLERQSEGARIYLKKREELKELDINAYLMDMERITGELKKTESDIEITDKELTGVREEKKKNENDYNLLQNRIDELDTRTGDINEALSEASVERQRMDGEIKVLQEQINSIKSSDAQFAERLTAISGDVEKKKASIEEYTREEEGLKKNLEDAVAKTAQAGAKLSEIQGRLSKQKDISEQSKNEMMSLLDRISQLKADSREYNTRAEALRIRRADINKKSIERALGDQEQKEALNETKARCDELLDRRESLLSKLDDATKQMEEWHGKEEELRRSHEAAVNDYNTKKSRLEALRNIAERYEGYGSATRSVLEYAGEDSGVLGVVADLMRVDSKYETAIEVSLGGNIQNIVTDNENTAKEMIDYLKKNRLGRVTFLPLSNVRGGNTEKYERGLGEPGAIGMADSLVECDMKYRGIYKFLLGRVMVVDNIDHAYAIARKYNFSLHLVTLEGEYLNPGGAVSGGAFKNKSNLLGRNRELADLRKAVDELSEKIAKHKDRLNDLQTAAELCADDVENLRSDLHELDVELSAAKITYDNMKSQTDASVKAAEDLKREGGEIAQELEEVEKLLSDSGEELSALEGKKDEITDKDESSSDEIDRLSAEVERENGIYQSMQIAEAKARTALDYAAQSIERLKAEIEELSFEQHNIEETLKQHGTDEICITDEIERVEKSAADKDRAIEELKEKQREAAAQKEKLFNENKEFYIKNDEINERLSNLEKELFRQTERKKRLNENEDSLNAYIWEEYELTLHNCEAMRNEKYDSLPQLKRQISTIKEEIKALGPVNVNAIEDYKELYERHTFMTSQRDDLLEAEKTLVDLIRELDEGMRAQFSEKFREIQIEFDKVFKELFGGGKGELTLVEDEDILEAGIGVTAQPPGKKLQNMMVLSGGERALTAIALLFAIQNLKPSPFCLLDEIEAALDDSNVDRFARYLKKLTDKSQFIVITHRRGTMNAADVLYGITMQEKGVSALVSVSLIEADIEREEKESRRETEEGEE